MNGKIRKIGKVCKIFSKIFTVLMIIATAGLFIAGTVLVAIPEEKFSAEITGRAQIDVYGEWVRGIPAGDVDKLSEKIEEGSLNINVDASKVFDIEKTDDGVTLNAESGTRGFSLRMVGLGLMAYALVTGALIAVFIMLGKLMKELSVSDTPFTDGVVKRMTGFAISLIPYAVLKPAASGIARSLITAGQFDVNFGADLSTAFAALVIILLIMIFKYGVVIQRESDETL